ncbi:unnamed protein product [Orchesella dallaii]|uniref:E3 ubiquitin-protein ligase TRIM33 n=1 Tax=Orchesella dallaii TaxID=48710 RepID=A0ABP1R831_9HEXA
MVSKMEPDGLETMDTDEELNDPNVVDDLPWTKCVEGCNIDENKEVISLTCLHTICSDECLAKMKAHSRGIDDGEVLYCGICQASIAPEDLEHRIVPSVMFGKKSSIDIEDIVVTCENCVLDLPAIAYCVDCSLCLCEQCKLMHTRARSTHLHQIKDCLEEQKQKQVVNLRRSTQKCLNHGDRIKTHYCFVCAENICEICIEEHAGHKIFRMQDVLDEMNACIETSRKLVEKFGRAKQDVAKKHDELLSDWKAVNENIHNKSYLLVKSFLKRMNELKFDGKRQFIKKKAGLNVKYKGIEYATTMTNSIMKACEEIVSNRNERSVINFVEQYRSPLNKVTELGKKFGQDYDLFVEKDWHFAVETDAKFPHNLSRDGFEGWGQIEYTYTPKVKPAAPTRTYAGVRKSANVGDSSKSAKSDSTATPSTSAGISLTSDVTEGAPKLQSRRIAVKSTGASQLSVNKVKTMSISVSNAVHSQTIDNEDGRSGLSMLLRKTYGKSASTGTGISNRVPTESSRLGIRESQHQKRAVDVKRANLIDVGQTHSTPSTSSTATDIDLNHSELQTLTNDKNEYEDIEGDSVSVGNDDQGQSDDTMLVSSSTMSKEESDRVLSQSPKLSSEDNETENSTQSRSHVRPSGASPGSSVSSPSEKSETPKLGLGKRERKKKKFPEFLDTDQSFKIMRLQNSASNSAAKRHTPSGTPKMPRLTQDGLIDPKNVKLEALNGEDCESNEEHVSNDGNTRGRRRLLRRKTVETPSLDSPEGIKRGRGRPKKNSILDTFEEAPLSTVENPPETSDFPVLGQGKMKVTNVDDNEDYCSICLDGGDELILCCDFCPKVFHLSCHIPPLKNGPPEGSWECNYSTKKEQIDKIISDFPEEKGSEGRPLVETNERHYLLACKFMMECYKIPQIPTMRWIFPRGYMETVGNGKVPYHLKYIYLRLSRADPEPFPSVIAFLRAFRQMFIQAFAFYKGVPQFTDYLNHASGCFEMFLSLVDQYYPEHRGVFNDVHQNADACLLHLDTC